MMTLQPLDFDGPRMVRREELGASDRLAHICFGGLDENAPAEDPPAAFHPPRRGGLFVITHQGVPVSQIYIFHFQVKLSDGLIRVGSVGGVCTHPKFRERGLAGRLMEYCTQTLAREGARLMLISGGRGLYTRVGCVPTGKYINFTIQPKDSLPKQPGISLRRASSADADLCSRIYHTEPVHFIRPPAKFKERLTHAYGYVHSEAWIVEQAGRPAAYILMGIPWEYVGHPTAGIRHVREVAGSRTALVGALGQIMAQAGLREIQWPVAWQDLDTIQLLQDHGLSGNPQPLIDHTMRIINLPGLMADLRPYIQARLGKTLRRGLRFEQSGPLLGDTHADHYSIRRSSDRLDLSGADMTRLVMGDPENVGVTAAQAPEKLGEIISGLFPLPSFLPGLNYQ